MDTAISRLRQAHSQGYVVGLKEVADNQGGAFKRFDVDELLWWYPETFNLFLLAFQAIKDEDPKNIHSFYQLAGIHGLPKEAWNNVQPPQSTGLEKLVGYCVHSDVLFPPWHRPYMALLEQTLFLRCIDIAENFPYSVRDRYRQAALRFRLPYWDYFRPRGRNSEYPTIRDAKNPKLFDYDFSVPTVLTIEKLMIRTPSRDEPTLMDNPLRFSRFPKDSSVSIDDSSWASTLGIEADFYSKDRSTRHPTKEEPEGDTVRLNKVANMRREDNNRYLLNILLADIYGSITSFATDADTSTEETNDITSGSLEAMHNDYHGTVGGIGGHMANVPIAAFDPIFFLHHVNVDRYFAIWQAAHPDAWFNEPRKPGEEDKETKSLIPFKTTKGGSVDGYWTAGGCRDTRALGYFYGDADRPTPAEVKENFKKWYEWSRRLYGVNYQKCPFDIIDLKRSRFFAFGNVQGADYYRKQIPEVGGSDPEYPPKREDAVFSREWYIDNKVSRLALNGAFTIFWFIEEDPAVIKRTQPKDYVLLPSLAGLSHVFAAPIEACDNCGDQQDDAHVIANTKPITSLLLDYVEVDKLGSLDPEHVVPFLQKTLRWRIVRTSGEQVDPATVENFQVGVTVKATPLPRSANKAPVYLEYPQVTQAIKAGQQIAAAKARADADVTSVANKTAQANTKATIGPERQPSSGAGSTTLPPVPFPGQTQQPQQIYFWPNGQPMNLPVGMQQPPITFPGPSR